MKKTTILFCIMGLTQFAFAQQRNWLMGGVGIYAPQATLKSGANIGWGYMIGYERVVSNSLHVTGWIGTMTFGSKTVTAPTIPATTVKFSSHMDGIQAGAKYYLPAPKQRRFFVYGESGVHILSGKILVNGQDATPPTEVHWSYSLGGGYHFGKLELSCKEQWIRAGGLLRFGEFRLSYFIFNYRKAAKENKKPVYPPYPSKD